MKTPADLKRIRLQATFDQARALFRDERRKLAKITAALQKANWHVNPHNVSTLAQYLIRDLTDSDDIRAAVRWAIEDAPKYRAEFVCGRCLELDSKKD